MATAKKRKSIRKRGRVVMVKVENLRALNWPETDQGCFCPSCGAMLNTRTGECNHAEECWLAKAIKI